MRSRIASFGIAVAVGVLLAAVLQVDNVAYMRGKDAVVKELLGRAMQWKIGLVSRVPAA
jgi:hypothetical protein